MCQKDRKRSGESRKTAQPIPFKREIYGNSDEEKLLSNDLPGYTEYAQKVRYRLVPYLW